MTTLDPDDIRVWAARLVRDWPGPTPEEADLLRRIFRDQPEREVGRSGRQRAQTA